MAFTQEQRTLQVAVCLCLAATALAQNIPNFPGSPNNGGGNNNGGTGTGTGSGSGTGTGTGSGTGSGNNPFSGFGQDGNGNGNFPGGFSSFLGFDVNRAMYLRMVHGVVASVAFVFLFPLGSILLRIIPGRFSFFAHVITQILASLLYIAGAGIGFWMVATIRFQFQGGSFSLLTDPNVNYHPIIGIVVFVGMLLQPVLGWVHHMQFKKLRRRQIWSYLHLWNGRILITLGIINGGLGLLVSRAPDRYKTVYAIVAAIMWTLWLLAALFGECRRAIAVRRESRRQRKEAKRLEREAAKLTVSRPPTE